VDGLTLNQWIRRAHELLATHHLSRNEFDDALRDIMWQLTATVHALHHRHHVVHLDLVVENIIVKNCAFVPADGVGRTQSFRLCGRPLVTIIDFGVAEQIEPTADTCTKEHLTVTDEIYQSPAVYGGEEFDPRAADMWSLGIIFYSLSTGFRPYVVQDIFQADLHTTGYSALRSPQMLRAYLKTIGTAQWFDDDALDFLTSLLHLEDEQRLTSTAAVQHRYFARFNGELCSVWNPASMRKLASALWKRTMPRTSRKCKPAQGETCAAQAIAEHLLKFNVLRALRLMSCESARRFVFNCEL